MTDRPQRRWRQPVAFEITMTIHIEAPDEEAAYDVVLEELELYRHAIERDIPHHWNAVVEAFDGGTDLPEEVRE